MEKIFLNKRNNYLSIANRTGYSKMPIDFSMCPSLNQKLINYLKANNIVLKVEYAYKVIPDLVPVQTKADDFRKNFNFELKEGEGFLFASSGPF